MDNVFIKKMPLIYIVRKLRKSEIIWNENGTFKTKIILKFIEDYLEPPIVRTPYEIKPDIVWKRKQDVYGQYELISGKDCLYTISKFFNNEIPLSKRKYLYDGQNIAGLYYKDLPLDLQRILNFSEVIIFKDRG